MRKNILNLDNSETCYQLDILLNVIKTNSNIFADILYKIVNRSLEVDIFLSSMKLAKVRHVYKKLFVRQRQLSTCQYITQFIKIL